MDFGIDSVEEIVLQASMRAIDVVKLFDDMQFTLPTENFINHHVASARAELQIAKKCQSIRPCDTCNDLDAVFCKKCGERLLDLDDVWIDLEDFSWCLSGAASTLDVLMKDIAPLVKGEVQVVFFWEDNTRSGFAIKDGRAVKCQSKLSIVLPEGWLRRKHGASQG